MHKFIIDTNQYAGNFEREMCAFITGRIGECQVGSEEAELFENDGHKPFENVVDTLDEHRVARPCSIEQTPNYFNTGLGNQYCVETKPSDEQILEDYAESVENYSFPLIKQKENIIKILEEGKTYSNWTIEGAKREIESHKKNIEKAWLSKTYNKFPAYNSVAIFFKGLPEESQTKLMKERAEIFARDKREKEKYGRTLDLRIEGFRLIKADQE